MKAIELLRKISGIDPDTEIVCYSEDKEVLSLGHTFRIFDIEDVDISYVKRCRNDDGVATFVFEKTENSEKVLTLNITSEF